MILNLRHEVGALVTQVQNGREAPAHVTASDVPVDPFHLGRCPAQGQGQGVEDEGRLRTFLGQYSTREFFLVLSGRICLFCLGELGHGQIPTKFHRT